MATAQVAARLVRITGQDQVLIDQLKDPLTRALGDRHSVYMVDVDTVGRVGQVLVSISGFRGRACPCSFNRKSSSRAMCSGW